MKTSPIRCELDHLVVGAQSLDEGAGYIADLLGVPPVKGGVHPNMGTHNVLLSLGARSIWKSSQSILTVTLQSIRDGFLSTTRRFGKPLSRVLDC